VVLFYSLHFFAFTEGGLDFGGEELSIGDGLLGIFYELKVKILKDSL
jgi:hypothetical protein